MLSYERQKDVPTPTPQGEDIEMTEEPIIPEELQETPRLDPALRAYIEQDAQLFKKERANARRFQA